VLLTSLKDDASRQKGILVGATAFLSKPVAVNELREKVATLLKLPLKKS
jgi:twitching motility two-component system response regulator PilG